VSSSKGGTPKKETRAGCPTLVSQQEIQGKRFWFFCLFEKMEIPEYAVRSRNPNIKSVQIDDRMYQYKTKDNNGEEHPCDENGVIIDDLAESDDSDSEDEPKAHQKRKRGESALPSAKRPNNDNTDSGNSPVAVGTLVMPSELPSSSTLVSVQALVKTMTDSLKDANLQMKVTISDSSVEIDAKPASELAPPAPPAPLPLSNEKKKTRASQIEALTAELRQFDDNALKNGKTQMSARDRALLIQNCELVGVLPCTMGSCRKVKELDCFSPSGRKQFLCMACQSRSGRSATALYKFKRSLQLSRLMDDRPNVKDNGGKEDAFVEWMLPYLESKFRVIVMPEFRKADLIFQLKGATNPDEWLRLQVKTGELDARGHVTFSNCLGYGSGPKDDNAQNRMLVLCARTQTNVEKSIVGTPTLWLLDGARIPTDTMNTSRKDPTILCHKTLHEPCISMASVLDRLSKACTDTTYPTTTYNSAWCDLEWDTQRKEAFGMLAFLHVGQGFKIEFPNGNQSTVDSKLDLNDGNGAVESQHKTLNPKNGHVLVSHSDKGVVQRPYGAWDGIGRLVPQLIVKDGSGGDFYLLYASIPKKALTKPRRLSNGHSVQNTVFATRDEKSGLINFSGKGCIHLPLGRYSQWLTGKKAHKLNKPTEWLEEGTEFGLRKPLKITPETGPDARLTVEVLDEIAYIAKRPSLFP